MEMKEDIRYHRPSIPVENIIYLANVRLTLKTSKNPILLLPFGLFPVLRTEQMTLGVHKNDKKTSSFHFVGNLEIILLCGKVILYLFFKL